MLFGKIRKSAKLGSLQSRTKYLAQNREIQSNTGQEEFNNYFYVFFKCYLLKFNFRKGGWALGHVSTLTWDFPVLFGNSWGNLYIEFVVAPDIRFRFTCGESDLD